MKDNSNRSNGIWKNDLVKRKAIYLIALLLICTIKLLAEQHPADQQGKDQFLNLKTKKADSFCGTQAFLDWQKEQNPKQYDQVIETLKGESKSLQRIESTSTGITYHIPVVFHIIGDQTVFNDFPQSRIQDQLDRLNHEFNTNNGANISFCLAQETPDGIAWTAYDERIGSAPPIPGITYSNASSIGQSGNELPKPIRPYHTLPSLTI